MTNATYDEASATWVIVTEGGRKVCAKYLMMCVGLSTYLAALCRGMVFGIFFLKNTCSA
jgi:hypothetical protein